MTIHDEQRERRLRQAARARGLVARKSRRRDSGAPDFGRWFFVRSESNVGVGDWQIGYCLDEAIAFLAD